MNEECATGQARTKVAQTPLNPCAEETTPVMDTAPSQDWGHFTSLYLAAATRLATIGVTVTETPLPTRDVARWAPAEQTLHIRPDATLEDRVWVLCDLLRATLHGPACADAKPAPRVSLVS